MAPLYIAIIFIMFPFQFFKIYPTELRQNEDYIYHYHNNARLLVTGIVPFVALLFFNLSIYRALQRRRIPLGK